MQMCFCYLVSTVQESQSLQRPLVIGTLHLTFGHTDNWLCTVQFTEDSSPDGCLELLKKNCEDMLLGMTCDFTCACGGKSEDLNLPHSVHFFHVSYTVRIQPKADL